MTSPPDDSELAGLDPFDAMDTEAERIANHLAALPPKDWSRPSRCEGWSTKDVLAHLAASEAYHAACLDGTVKDFVADLGARGATDLDSANALGVEEFRDLRPEQLLAEWREANALVRRRFRERGDGTIDTSVGDYPCRWQAFHVATELATHADDIGVTVAAAEEQTRRDWRARFSRFALSEAKPDLTITTDAGRTRVLGPHADVELDDDELIGAVQARLTPSDRFSQDVLARLSTMP
ncbi:MAG TPA: maleylpyruvate isomerase family mycothiol-dependent enzyme [Acidimicrobiales bacterium]